MEIKFEGDTVEMAYRRGYTQGFFAALESIRKGHSLDECQMFLENELFGKWHYNREGNFPPSILPKPRR